MEEKRTVLDIRHLSVTFTQYSRGFQKTELPVIRDLNVRVREGEMTAVVGSSGSGKSLLAHAVMDILPYNAGAAGEIEYCGEPLTSRRVRKLRGSEIVLVPQSVAYLDPLMKVGGQLKKGRKDRGTGERIDETLARYGLEPEVKRKYPFELSGGMARRILISTAVIERPKLVIADEPTPGLHLDTARRVLGHFRELADGGAGVLLITHDLELALTVADRVVVFYAGTTVEEAAAADFDSEESLRHPYTKALYRAMPKNGFQSIPGTQPFVKNLPEGCPFAPRCDRVREQCAGEIPYREVRDGFVRCIR